MSGSLIRNSLPSIKLIFTNTFLHGRNQNYQQLRAFSTHTDPQTQLQTQTKTPTQKQNKMPLSVYTTETLNMSEKQSLAASKKIITHRRDTGGAKPNDLISSQNADKVITFFQQHCGLTQTHIQQLVYKCPRILLADVDKTIQPKVTLLRRLGFSDLPHVICLNPDFYLFRDLTRAIETLRGVLGSECDEIVGDVIKRSRFTGRIVSHLIANVGLLKDEYGVPVERIRTCLRQFPPLFMIKTETLRKVAVSIEEKWGISRNSSVFMTAAMAFCSLSDETVDSKVRVFSSYGWSDSDVGEMIKKLPTCIGLSEARIKKSLEFLMNVLGYEPAYIAARPVMIASSLENKVVPRERVVSILKEKGLIKAGYHLSSALLMSESKFFDQLIFPFEHDVPKLREVYTNGSVSGELDG